MKDPLNLLRELGIVVTGVIIALGGGQVVEAIHHSNERHDLQQALDRDSREAVMDSQRCAASSDVVIAWLMGRIAEVQVARSSHHVLPPPQPLKVPYFQVPDDPAFKAASSSGTSQLLSQDNLLAYAEAHAEEINIERLYNPGMDTRGRLQSINDEFRESDGRIRFDNASIQDLDDYFSILEDLLYFHRKIEHHCKMFGAVEGALLRRERGLGALRESEDSAFPRGEVMSWM